MGRKQTRHSKHGLTLMELVVVLAILAILSAIAVPAAFGSLRGLEARTCRSSRDSIHTAYVLGQKLAGRVATLEEVVNQFNSTGSVHNETMTGCPSGGLYSVSGDDIVCSEHPDA